MNLIGKSHRITENGLLLDYTTRQRTVVKNLNLAGYKVFHKKLNDAE